MGACRDFVYHLFDINRGDVTPCRTGIRGTTVRRNHRASAVVIAVAACVLVAA